jgi:hypothetical protein
MTASFGIWPATPSEQTGFVATDRVPTERATDPQPPHNGITFAKEDIDELGLELCFLVWERTQT